MNRLKTAKVFFLAFLVLAVVGEIGARFYYFFRNGRYVLYLIVPLFGDRSELPSPGAPVKASATHTLYDPESKREITFTINNLGGRGADCPLQKTPWVTRVIAMGASSTYGTNNPDWATWPVFLEQALRRAGKKVEVFNASWPGIKIADIMNWYETQIVAYQPDLVIYYEGWNDTPLLGDSAEVDAQLRRFYCYTRWGRRLHPLHYRVMLFTYLMEKLEFEQVRRLKAQPLPDVAQFQTQLERFVGLIRQNHSIPVLVLQPNNSKPKEAVRNLPLEDRRAVGTFILEENRADPRTYLGGEKIRLYQAQILVEIVRRTGWARGIQVIDPRGVFSRKMDSQSMFYGQIHLTDEGNRRLASLIADEIHLP